MYQMNGRRISGFAGDVQNPAYRPAGKKAALRALPQGRFLS